MAQEHAQNQLEKGTYEIIRSRLDDQKADLITRLQELNQKRKDVFGNVEFKLIANDRINTDNNCIARDIVALDNRCIFGYNVHFGLRNKIEISDVFSAYEFREGHFHPIDLGLFDTTEFQTDFENLYKYYRNTIFAKFARIGNYLHMVFQVSEDPTDIKTFKWLVRDSGLQYIDNRSDHEYVYPDQYQFRWQTPPREMHRYGKHPHVSIEDKVFVETVGGDLTIKIEDNTDEGHGILEEPVAYADQTLDDADYAYADLGNLIPLKITPYQEDPRYFIYNHKVKEVMKVDGLADAAIRLPDDQGLLFPNGYYLQTGTFKRFEKSVPQVLFQGQIQATNGEDHLFVFYQKQEGVYLILPYNIIEQQVKTPIICNGFTILPQGQLCYIKAEADATKHHVVQIWQTPFGKQDVGQNPNADTLVFKIGNKDIVKAMAECHELIYLLEKEDSYDGLYDDLAKQAMDILDSYYWISEADTGGLNQPLQAIKDTADAAIDEFEKVVALRKNAVSTAKALNESSDQLFDTIKYAKFKSIEEFVQTLSELRKLRGQIIATREVRYINMGVLEAIDQMAVEQNEKVSQQCIAFLLKESALDPYTQKVEQCHAAIDKVKKVVEAKDLEVKLTEIGEELELLIEVVNNLNIEDATQTARIIDTISVIFTALNQTKAKLVGKRKSLGALEAQSDFGAQLKLLEQSVINYLDIADTADKCDGFLTKISVQLEEMEARFSEYDEFVDEIGAKREDLYNVFEERKAFLLQERNKKVQQIVKSAERILKGVGTKAKTFTEAEAIHGYFASDIMVGKTYDLIERLQEMEESGKAEELDTRLKTVKEEVLRRLKDRQELFEDGEDSIRLGNHKFGVNRQPLELSVLYRDGAPHFHLSGTNFYERILEENPTSPALWEQSIPSENHVVYRAEYLAYKVFLRLNGSGLESDEALGEHIADYITEHYNEGYIKGVHDQDALQIVKVLHRTHQALGVLTFTPNIRSNALLFWFGLEETVRKSIREKVIRLSQIAQLFPHANTLDQSIAEIMGLMETTGLVDTENNGQMAGYLVKELQRENGYTVSQQALDLKERFLEFLKEKDKEALFQKGVEQSVSLLDKMELTQQWLGAFVRETGENSFYEKEACGLLLFPSLLGKHSNPTDPLVTLENLMGDHQSISEGRYAFDYHAFMARLGHFDTHTRPGFENLRLKIKEWVGQKRAAMRLGEFKPKVLSSFVRNQLIDKVYLPLIGDNLAKQLGTVGGNQRTDRMGMLLLISPPGYGKTTLMEYVANRLGLTFVKVNGPAIGHNVVSVDPGPATSVTAKEELKKLNLAFEMENNVMLYLDDIQHCNPEFLQKFISLADGQRKIEGVYNGQSKTYDLRGKKFCVIMAGNPYTESGEKFQIPDMLANRADIYNLGDIIGGSDRLFKLSLIENALTSNPYLRELANRHYEDVYTLLEAIEKESQEGLQMQGNHSQQEIDTYMGVLRKMLQVRDIVLKVNATYIKSASMEDVYREEPAFKLQGSYRDMNKMASKVIPIMNPEELQGLIDGHYENESQTLTAAAEANLLKYKELAGVISAEELERWNAIKTTFLSQAAQSSHGQIERVVGELSRFGRHLEGIRKALLNDKE